MPTYDAPGVYVEEQSGGAKPIRAVSTSTACFVGFTEKASLLRRKDGVETIENLALKPTMVTNWSEYQEAFGGYVAGIYTPLSVNGFFENGGTKCYIVSIGQVAEKINQILLQLPVEDKQESEIKTPTDKVEHEVEQEALVDGEPVANVGGNELADSEEAAPKIGNEHDKDPVDTTNDNSQANANKNDDRDHERAGHTQTSQATGRTLKKQIIEKVYAESCTMVSKAEKSKSSAINAMKQTQSKCDEAEENITILEDDKRIAANSLRAAETMSAEVAKEAREEFERIEKLLSTAQDKLRSYKKQLEKAKEAAEEADKNLLKFKKANSEAKSALDAVNKAVEKSGVLNKYLTVKAKQSSSDPLLRIRIEPATSANGRAGNADGNPAAENGERQIRQFELIVEQKRQSVLADPDRQWKELERKGVIVLVDEKEQLKLKYRGGRKPQYVDVTIDSTLRPNVNNAPSLATPLGNDLNQVQQAAPQIITLNVDSSELARVGATTITDGEPDGRDPVFGILSDYEDISIICMPDLMLAHQVNSDKQMVFFDGQDPERFVQNIQQKIIAHCENMGERVVILDPPRNKNFQEVKAWIRGETAGYDTSYGALYYPWIKVMDPATNEMIEMPPSGHVAGVWARSDNQRGVHKAPANEVIRGVLDLSEKISHRHQETLNPIGVNCIRFFPGRGYRIWGARTLSSDPEWKYLNVRRLFNMIKQSIQESTQWAVFEPNDQRLWSKLRRDVGNFLLTLYSQGALFGATASQAFFVKCDETNNKKITRDLGQLFVDIGIAPVLPAEFIIFRIRQWSDEEPEE